MNKKRNQCWIFLFSLGLLCFLTFLLGVTFGSKPLPFSEVITLLFNPDESYNSIVVQYRLPRTYATLICGLALGGSGILIQGLTRNPLAESGLLGINSGAAAAMATALAFVNSQTSLFMITIAGALTTACLVGYIGLNRGQQNQGRLLLFGMALTVLLSTYNSTLSLLWPDIFDEMRFWMGGDFSHVDADQLLSLFYCLILCLMGAIFLAPYLNLMSLEAQTVRALGANILLIQISALFIASLLAAISVAIAGPISFVGLGAAHIARLIFRVDYRWLVPGTMLVGGALLVGSDVIARIVIAPNELATGIVTSLIGAPLLYLLLIKKTRRGI